MTEELGRGRPGPRRAVSARDDGIGCGGSPLIHPSAEVHPEAHIGEGARIWHGAVVRERAVIGPGCVVGMNVYIDVEVEIGAGSKIQNGASIYRGVTLEEGVFIGPGACTSNDRYPRAITPDGRQKGPEDWQVEPTRICLGASIGVGAVLLSGINIGRFAMVSGGAVVHRSVPEQGLVVGVPARLIGTVCLCGVLVKGDVGDARCPACRGSRLLDASG